MTGVAARPTTFRKMFANNSIAVGLVETMGGDAQDMSAQLSKIKASDADTLIVTTAVEQLTLLFKQAAALGLERRSSPPAARRSPTS